MDPGVIAVPAVTEREASLAVDHTFCGEWSGIIGGLFPSVNRGLHSVFSGIVRLLVRGKLCPAFADQDMGC
jgi:hypothetical protein